MSPIRIGFIGLSSNQSWAVWAHYPYLKDSSKYTIVALQNSSLEAAQTAIKVHGLPASTKAYGTPEELAADPNVDLVIVCTRVDMHYAGLLPALKAGKDVFCEWPLAQTTAQAEELASIAKEKNVKTFVGIQAPQSPALNKIRTLLRDGRIGKVLSSTFYGTPKFFGKTELEALSWSHDISVGGNLVSIYALHALESIQYTLAPLVSYTSLLAQNFKETELISYTGEPRGTIPRTSHDQVLLQGSLSCGAPVSFHLRGGPAFNDKIGSIWHIYGSAGEIKITGPDSYLQISDDNLNIEIFDHASKKTEVLSVEKDAFSELPLFARNIARLYDAIADGKGIEDGVLDFETAVKRHQFIDEIYKRAGVQ